MLHWTKHFVFRADTDFDRCNKTAESLLENNNVTYFLRSSEHARGTLTYSACEKLCGVGLQMWPTEQIISRFALWLIPAIVVMAHYHFPAHSTWNSIALAMRHISDPVDSMWSLTTRLELQRRRLYLAEKMLQDSSSDTKRACRGINAHCAPIYGCLKSRWENFCNRFRSRVRPDAFHLAAIWCAYDEFGFTDALAHVHRNLEPPLGSRELDLIRQAAHDLTLNRTGSQRQTLAAIVGYVVAVLAAFVRTRMTRQNNQTSHTIAVVSLFSYFVALVLMSSTIGEFRSIPEALHTLQKLRRDIGVHRETHPTAVSHRLFPTIFLPSLEDRHETKPCPDHCSADMENRDSAEMTSGEAFTRLLTRQTELRDDYQVLKEWMSIAPWTGMNGSFRPCKAIPADVICAHRNRHSGFHLFCSMTYVIGGCYVPALLLSLFSGNIGFGCRCMAWTVVLAIWIFSLYLDSRFKGLSSAEKIWKYTIAKDFIMASAIIAIILAIQIGALNNCICRANIFWGDSGVYLGGFRDEEWARNWKVWPAVTVGGLMLMISFGYIIHVIEVGAIKEGFLVKVVSGVLCKAQKDQEKDLLVQTKQYCTTVTLQGYHGLQSSQHG